MTFHSKHALDRSLASFQSATKDAVDPVDLARLEHAVRRLPRRQREIFLAVRLDNLSYPDIAERTGLSVREVERHFASSLLNLSVHEPRRKLRGTGGGLRASGRRLGRPTMADLRERITMSSIAREHSTPFGRTTARCARDCC